ncbi:MAG: bifunctional precorrin-2 dehydrogenase/sirohydrochlorin ferrochelatase [Caldilineaceae bacterium]|nr:bifunctional precorrin-2 dehydrogenase/sirohydrochlorin ferrochelatase [Caldilineaceae bacterium]
MLPITLTHAAEMLAIVVGGGKVGERKVRGLVDAGVRVRLISPVATPKLQKLATARQIEWIERGYQPGDLSGARLVVAATNVRAVNHAVAQEAHEDHLLINVADCPEEGNVHMPAVHRDENLVVAVNSRTARPRVAVVVRDWIAGMLPSYPW